MQLAAHRSHTCALLDDERSVLCWGWGGYGKLGIGYLTTIGDDEVPAAAPRVCVVEPPDNRKVIQLAVGGTHTCTLLDTGDIRCWGSNFYGQLGYGNPESIGDDELPCTAGDVDVGGTAVQVVAGDTHTCALLDTGEVRCWGQSQFGQLGYGNVENIGDDETPYDAGNVDVGGRVVQLTAGYWHTCALLDTGAIRCWGQGANGRLGNYGSDDLPETIGDDELPSTVPKVELGDEAVHVTGGANHTCALLKRGAVRCWGHGAYGALGHGNCLGSV